MPPAVMRRKVRQQGSMSCENSIGEMYNSANAAGDDDALLAVSDCMPLLPPFIIVVVAADATRAETIRIESTNYITVRFGFFLLFVPLCDGVRCGSARPFCRGNNQGNEIKSLTFFITFLFCFGVLCSSESG